MSSVPTSELSEAAVVGFFERDASNWQSLYGRTDDVFAVIHQLRHQIALTWIRDLGLPPGARAVEVGCGAGLASVDMARLGLSVRAVDSTEAMVALAGVNVRAAGLSHLVETGIANAHHLDDPTASADLLVALGVLPWLRDPEEGLAEMARVLRPGGWLVANVDNRRRLNVLLDPLYTPALAPLRRVLRRRSKASPDEVPDTIKHTPAEYRRMLARHGLEPVRASGFGFGPFTLLGRRVLPGRRGVQGHRALQWLADRRVPGLTATGAQYLVLARKA